MNWRGLEQMSRVYSAKFGIKAADEGLVVEGRLWLRLLIPFRDGIDAAAAAGFPVLFNMKVRCAIKRLLMRQ